MGLQEDGAVKSSKWSVELPEKREAKCFPLFSVRNLVCGRTVEHLVEGSQPIMPSAYKTHKQKTPIEDRVPSRIQTRNPSVGDLAESKHFI